MSRMGNFICPNCFGKFDTEDKLFNHLKMSKEDKKLAKSINRAEAKAVD